MSIKEILERRTKACLGAYDANPDLLREHFGIEQTMLAGGYGYRQVLELVQNGADAILEETEERGVKNGANCVEVLLRDNFLYVANTGAPLSDEGIGALLSSHDSPKRGNEIGRFGLGFKSLLRLGGCIDIITRGRGALRFDPKRCEKELKQRYSQHKVPGLRLAWPLEESEYSSDPNLPDLKWAQTIVRVAVTAAEQLLQLQEEIRNFPAEFLLFFPVAVDLTLNDGQDARRELKVQRDGDVRILQDGYDSARWRVVQRDVVVTDPSAIADATAIHARASSVPVTWAVPLDTRGGEMGRFWAFFPTHTASFISGIINAPWKLNNDRNAIIGGRWNEVLMKEAAHLIVDTIPTLLSGDDPGRILDAFPRQLDRKDDDAAALVNAMWSALQTAKVIPDGTGQLRKASDIWQYPKDEPSLVRDWIDLASRTKRAKYIHPSCLERQRLSRLNNLGARIAVPGTALDLPMLRRADAAEWFGEIASLQAKSAMRALRLADSYRKDCKGSEWPPIREQLEIIPTEDSHLVKPNKAVIAPGAAEIPGYKTVLNSVSATAEMRQILVECMGVRELDEGFWGQQLRELLPKGTDIQDDRLWKSWWKSFRKMDKAFITEFIEDYGEDLRVRRGDGAWVRAFETLLPGSLVLEDEVAANHGVLLDLNFHQRDLSALRALGASDSLGDEDDYDDSPDDGECGKWLEQCRRLYTETYNNRAKIDCIEPETFWMPKGWRLLPTLVGFPRARLTRKLMGRVSAWDYRDVTLSHAKSPKRFDQLVVTHPLGWYLMHFGVLQVGPRVVTLAAVVARHTNKCVRDIAGLDELAQTLERLQQVSPIPIGLPTRSDLKELWVALINALDSSRRCDDDALELLWQGAAADGVVPKCFRCLQDDLKISEVYVTTSSDLARRARTASRFVFSLDEATLERWTTAGAKRLSDLLKLCYVEAAPAERLAIVLPELRSVLSKEAHRSARATVVHGLRMDIEGIETSLPCVLHDEILLIDSEQVFRLSRVDRLKRMVSEVAQAGWLDTSQDEALRLLGDADVEKRQAEVAAGATLAERLLRAVGNLHEPLLRVLCKVGNLRVVGNCTPLQLAELALASRGPAVLSELREDLEKQGLKPPSRWNTSEAFAFVASLGFPDDFASAAESKREAEEYISGPIDLPDLHDYQQEVLEGIAEVLARGSKRRRAVVSLPTGGGKTRVTVEAAVRLVLKPDVHPRNVLWIAQTDELCEQAVQAFRQVWLNVGARNVDLRIVRMWGGNPTPALRDASKPVVVVASIQTLSYRAGDDKLSWLQKPGLVVLDECHHAIAPSYTSMLRWLDAANPLAETVENDEPPIIGLSATPFRTDDVESQRLAKRFENRWLPRQQENLHAKLRMQGVLAAIENEPLESKIGLLDAELEQLTRLSEPWEGFEFEQVLERINRRLAGDSDRNQLLVDYVKSTSARSILFFANSVAHAEEMAARLHLVGVPAAAISGETPTVARRYFLQQFQQGDLRVLCNHSVLSTGFDAPRTDMVLIARQVFSPVRYMQMVGRGLRGEKNGGTKSCRIVSVLDNLGRFQDRHPYHFCQRYFR